MSGLAHPCASAATSAHRPAQQRPLALTCQPIVRRARHAGHARNSSAQPHQWHRTTCNSTQAEGSIASTSAPAASAPAPEEVVVTLPKPVGLVFAQKPGGGPVYVEEVTPGGAADKTGRVKVGDILARCSAVVLKSGADTDYNHGQVPYNNFQKIDFDCKGQDFKTVMSALKSNNARWGILDVTLVFQKQGSAS